MPITFPARALLCSAGYGFCFLILCCSRRIKGSLCSSGEVTKLAPIEIRRCMEEREQAILSPYAALSACTGGRIRKEPPCPVRTAYQRDRDRILHSKAFRRLKHKTQVFIAPEGDHYRTRLTHTLEVSQVARTIARALNLNEDLTEAIALGHDLGHTPFGHAGEMALNKLCPGGFRHNEQSLRVVDQLEEGGGGKECGLNLTLEVRDGILNHTGPQKPVTLEGGVVRLADRFAYINHDIDDALRAGILNPADLPRPEMDYLGHTSSARLNTMVVDMIAHSLDRPQISISTQLQRVIESLRSFMFARVYTGSPAKQEEFKTGRMIEQVFYYLEKNPGLIVPPADPLHGGAHAQRVTDYIAGMTDRFIISLYQEIFIPKPWRSPG